MSDPTDTESRGIPTSMTLACQCGRRWDIPQGGTECSVPCPCGVTYTNVRVTAGGMLLANIHQKWAGS
jgi:hypothetical protein